MVNPDSIQANSTDADQKKEKEYSGVSLENPAQGRRSMQARFTPLSCESKNIA